MPRTILLFLSPLQGTIGDMTKLLEQAFSKAMLLPESEQDAIAQLLLEEMQSDERWDELFAKSPEKRRKLADEAWAEHEAGKRDVDFAWESTTSAHQKSADRLVQDLLAAEARGETEGLDPENL